MQHIDRRVFLFAFVWIVFAVAGGLGIRYYQERSDQNSDTNWQNVLSESTGGDFTDQELLKRVSKHMVLPAVTPEIVTLTDVDTLKREQPFFAGARDGFKLLVYPEKVILYDPVRDVIVDFAHIRPDEE